MDKQTGVTMGGFKSPDNEQVAALLDPLAKLIRDKLRQLISQQDEVSNKLARLNLDKRYCTEYETLNVQIRRLRAAVEKLDGE